MRLIVRIIVGIIAGILIGLYAPLSIATVVFSIKEVLGQFILFLVPLIIIFFVAAGIANLHRNGGKTLGLTVALAYSSTITAAILACFVALIWVPELVGNSSVVLHEQGALTAWIPIKIPPLMGVMTALVLAFIFGIGIMKTQAQALRTGFNQGKDIVELAIVKVMIPILPLYIAGVFVEYAVAGTVFDVLKTFGYVLALALTMHFLWLLVLYIIAGIITRRNPLKALYNMLPAYFTALGTMSSAATIPVTIQQARKNDVSEPVADFCIPLCATIHLAGSAITLTTCAIAVAILTGNTEVLSLTALLPFIFMLGIIMVAAPGIPGGAVIAALGLLESMLGFSASTAVPLMIALYVAQDSFGTACNVTGDGAIALIVDEISGEAVADSRAS